MTPDSPTRRRCRPGSSRNRHDGSDHAAPPDDGCSPDNSPSRVVAAPGPAPEVAVRPESAASPLPDLAVRRINCAGGWVGLDPDVDRPPGEAVVLDRLVRGGFASSGRVADALLLAVVETGVPVWALDDERLDGPLGLRMASEGERVGEGELAAEAPAGQIVVADATRAVAVLFAAPSASHAPAARTVRARLYAIGVNGVPAIHVEEALWTAAEALAEA